MLDEFKKLSKEFVDKSIHQNEYQQAKIEYNNDPTEGNKVVLNTTKAKLDLYNSIVFDLNTVLIKMEALDHEVD